jgi:hypothetical protein
MKPVDANDLLCARGAEALREALDNPRADITAKIMRDLEAATEPGMPPEALLPEVQPDVAEFPPNEVLAECNVVEIGMSKPAAKAQKRTNTRAAPAWLADLIADDHGRPLPILANVLTALRAAPEISEAFGFDEMHRTTVLLRELPLAPGGERIDGPLPRLVRDVDVSRLQECLQH